MTVRILLTTVLILCGTALADDEHRLRLELEEQVRKIEAQQTKMEMKRLKRAAREHQLQAERLELEAAQLELEMQSGFDALKFRYTMIGVVESLEKLARRAGETGMEEMAEHIRRRAHEMAEHLHHDLARDHHRDERPPRHPERERHERERRDREHQERERRERREREHHERLERERREGREHGEDRERHEREHSGHHHEGDHHDPQQHRERLLELRRYLNELSERAKDFQHEGWEEQDREIRAETKKLLAEILEIRRAIGGPDSEQTLD